RSEAKQSRHEATVDCHTSTHPQSVLALLTGMTPAVPFPPQPGAEEIVRAEIRRSYTAQWRGQQNLIESTCPNVFQLQPRRGFETFDDTLEYLRKGEAWQLVLYCESDEEWHTAEHSVYDFDLHADWIENLRANWNILAGHMRTLAPFLKASGKLTGHVLIETLAGGTEKLPDIAADHRKLREELGDAYSPTRVDIEI